MHSPLSVTWRIVLSVLLVVVWMSFSVGVVFIGLGYTFVGDNLYVQRASGDISIWSRNPGGSYSSRAMRAESISIDARPSGILIVRTQGGQYDVIQNVGSSRDMLSDEARNLAELERLLSNRALNVKGMVFVPIERWISRNALKGPQISWNKLYSLCALGVLMIAAILAGLTPLGPAVLTMLAVICVGAGSMQFYWYAADGGPQALCNSLLAIVICVACSLWIHRGNQEENWEEVVAR